MEYTETNGGHLFENIGIGLSLKCRNCGLTIPREDVRLFGIKMTKEDVEIQARKAETLVEVLTALDENNFHEWNPKEVEDIKKIANDELSPLSKKQVDELGLLSTGRAEAAFNRIRYGRECGPNKLRR